MNRSNALRTFALGAAVVLGLSWLQLEPGAGPQIVSNTPGEGTTLDTLVDGEVVPGEGPEAGPEGGGTGPASGGGPGGRKTTATTSAAGPGAAGAECARGKNGGATDTGVTASKIRLATTAVLDGPAKSLLEDSPVAMKAVVDKVNKAGGICGRLLDLKVDNDSFDAAKGLQYIRNYIAEGYFALPVVPSAEGLGQAILNGEIAKSGIPVVGTDGMREEQYGDPHVWPVASATVTAMRVMAKYGYENRGARTFAIVYDDKYKFGKEGKDAFVDQVKKQGGRVVTEVPLNPDLPNYSSQILDFNKSEKCGKAGGVDQCDMVAFLLLPDTASKFLKGWSGRAKLYTAGAQTLFTDRFANDCVQYYQPGCEGFAVWTGYNPPIGPLASLPGVATYVNDVRSVKSSVDVTNQFVEGAYLGMSVFVEALKRVGPNLTRERLKQVMDSMTYTSDITSALSWRPGQHYANVRSQSFEMTVSQGTFRGWRSEPNGFLPDPAFTR